MSKLIGLFELTFALAFRGDGPGARASADATIEARQRVSGTFRAADPFGRRRRMPRRWRCCGGTGKRRWPQNGPASSFPEWTICTWSGRPKPPWHVASWPSLAAEPTSRSPHPRGSGWSTALSTRACVCVAQREYEQAAADAYESLMIANESGTHLSTADTLECLARMAFDADSHAEAARLLGAAESTRQRLGLVRFKVFDDDHHALVSALRNAMGGEDSTRRGTRGPRCRPRKPSPTRYAAAVNASGRPTGWGSLTPTELDVVRLVAEGCPTRTSPLGCSSHREPCRHISATSTTSSG